MAIDNAVHAGHQVQHLAAQQCLIEQAEQSETGKRRGNPLYSGVACGDTEQQQRRRNCRHGDRPQPMRQGK